MRKLLTLAIAAIAALAVAAPAASAQGVTVTADPDTPMSGHLVTIGQHYSGSGQIVYGTSCTVDMTTTLEQAGDGFLSNILYYAESGDHAACGVSTEACEGEDWPVQYYATGLSAPDPEFQADVTVCLKHAGFTWRGVVTADVELDGSTISTLQFDEDFFQGQTPPPGLGGVINRFGIDGWLAPDAPITIEAAE